MHLIQGCIPILLALMVSSSSGGDETGGSSGASRPGGDALPFAEAAEPDRREVRRYLDSPHWPFRTIALLRLERYAGGEVESLVRGRFLDPSWQVRCFAVRQAHRMGIEVRASELEGENDARVIRAAVRAGVRLDAVRLERGVRRLLRSSSPDQVLLGLEIAAGSDNTGLRNDAEGRGARFIRHMDEVEAVRFSRRLSRLYGAAAAPESAEAWRAWAAGQEGGPSFAPLEGASGRDDGGRRSVVAEMDGGTFSRLMDYLDALRQKDIDLVIVMDSTNSMMPMINEARAGVDSLILFFDDLARTMRLAFVAYRDYDNEPLFEVHPFRGDVNSIRRFLFRLRITGGADLPEAVLEGLTACKDLEWHAGAGKRVILVGDARPHEGDEYRIGLVLGRLGEKGVTVDALHVPQRPNARYLEALLPGEAERYREEVAEHTRLTGLAFAHIAAQGGGRKATIDEAEGFVPAVMHLNIEERWWPAFDEFYRLYVMLCR